MEGSSLLKRQGEQYFQGHPHCVPMGYIWKALNLQNAASTKSDVKKETTLFVLKFD